MAGFIYKGILLQQQKEPALSRQLREFLNADMIGLRLAREPVQDISTLTPDEIIDFAQDAGVVDERDGELLADKLRRAREKGCRCVVVDAIDDEPYLSSQINPMLKNPHLSPVGLTLCKTACGASEGNFAIYKNLSDIETRITRKLGDYPVVRLRGRYPAEYQAISRYNQQPDTLLVGAGAVIHLARAVLFGKPQTTTFITVAGDCISNPTNLEVTLGMTIAQTLDRCGLLDRPNRVVIGGSMTGVSVIDTENTVITPTTRAVLAFRLDKKSYGFDCIGCGRCVQSCPQGLNPFQIYRSIRGNRQDLMRKLSLNDCISCGVCSYTCPAKLDLSKMISDAAKNYAVTHDAIVKSEQHIIDYRQSIYRCYIADYQFGRAVIAHRKNRRRLMRDLVRWENQAKQEHRAIEQNIQNGRNQASSSLRQSEQQAEQTLNDARRAMQASHAAADHALALAKRSHEAVYRSSDRALLFEKRNCQAAERKADHEVELSASFQQQISAENIRAAEKALEALEKGKEPASPEAIQQAKLAIVQARLTADAATHETSAHAQQTCRRVKENVRSSLKQAGVICEQTKKDADQILENAKQSHAEKYRNAEQLFERAKQDCVVSKDQAHHVYELAAAVCDEQVVEENTRYAGALMRVRQRAFAKQKQIDDVLRKVRLEALAAARYAAWSRASVTGRPLTDADYTAPGHLFSSEYSLRVPSLRIPYDRDGYPEPNSPIFKQEVKSSVHQLLQMTPTQLAAAIHAFETLLAEPPAPAEESSPVPVLQPTAVISAPDSQEHEPVSQDSPLPAIELTAELIETSDDLGQTAEPPSSAKTAAPPLVWPVPSGSTLPDSAKQPMTTAACSKTNSEEDSGS